MNFSRWWTETTAAIGDRIPLPLVALLLVLAGVLISLAWFFFPAWVPRRLPRWRFSWRWRRRPARQTPEAEVEAADEAGPDLPDVPAAALVSLADRLAGDGRYADAVRERLRGMVRTLVDRGVLEHRPGMTVAELATAATRSRPDVDEPLGVAGGIFSDLWYGQRPARAEHDERMRELAAELDRALAHPPDTENGTARR
ncbi:DUF4129 domain-containing protein [Plantactinospora sp. S1510]|uniref:DUF4129 domain-containing protein n=1 Tax=Plantactinospora alkalitolerans TaxID=2789879 RepID=A0ABS0GNR4_9ACTN|nr:DUF4129 domain-containing protein [Plantactinospora alkalitolerans]MBF9127674.1 DUF4129 domain-containing protein [Plantactinospora alkalitolerans]